MVIAIDGPGGVGKSTVTKLVAERLAMAYLDTGAFYRAAALAALRAEVAMDDSAAIVDAVAGASFDFVDGEMQLDGASVADEIRTEAVTSASSAIAVIPEVRDLVNRSLRAWVDRHGGSAVVEGRDIGSVVFPDAPVKIYLDARPEVRAARRAADAAASTGDVARVAAALEERDERDSTRRVAPLMAAEDAIVVDTSDLTVDQVADEILRVAMGIF